VDPNCRVIYWWSWWPCDQVDAALVPMIASASRTMKIVIMPDPEKATTLDLFLGMHLNACPLQPGSPARRLEIASGSHVDLAAQGGGPESPLTRGQSGDVDGAAAGGARSRAAFRDLAGCARSGTDVGRS